MSKFEQVGINYQYGCNTIKECDEALEYSCNCCTHSSRCLWSDCDHCGIKQTHDYLVAIMSEKTEKQTDTNK